MAGRTLAFAGVVAALLFATGGVRAVEPQAASSQAAAASRTLLNQYCTACHNDRTKAGGLILDGLDPARVGEIIHIFTTAGTVAGETSLADLASFQTLYDGPAPGLTGIRQIDARVMRVPEEPGASLFATRYAAKSCTAPAVAF